MYLEDDISQKEMKIQGKIIRWAKLEKGHETNKSRTTESKS